MEPLKPLPTFKVYTLIKQTGLHMTYIYSGGGSNITFGPGFYSTRQEAEQHRTLELLKNTDGPGFSEYHVFELEVPNPAYKK